MKGPRHFLSENLANGKQLQTEGHSIVCFILLAYNVNAHVQYDLSTTSVPDQRKSLFTKCGGAQEALDRNKQVKLVESYIKTKRADQIQLCSFKKYTKNSNHSFVLVCYIPIASSEIKNTESQITSCKVTPECLAEDQPSYMGDHDKTPGPHYSNELGD